VEAFPPSSFTSPATAGDHAATATSSSSSSAATPAAGSPPQVLGAHLATMTAGGGGGGGTKRKQVFDKKAWTKRQSNRTYWLGMRGPLFPAHTPMLRKLESLLGHSFPHLSEQSFRLSWEREQARRMYTLSASALPSSSASSSAALAPSASSSPLSAKMPPAKQPRLEFSPGDGSSTSTSPLLLPHDSTGSVRGMALPTTWMPCPVVRVTPVQLSSHHGSLGCRLSSQYPLLMTCGGTQTSSSSIIPRARQSRSCTLSLMYREWRRNPSSRSARRHADGS
jgi:hypothetical protein